MAFSEVEYLVVSSRVGGNELSNLDPYLAQPLEAFVGGRLEPASATIPNPRMPFDRVLSHGCQEHVLEPGQLSLPGAVQCSTYEIIVELVNTSVDLAQACESQPQ